MIQQSEKRDVTYKEYTLKTAKHVDAAIIGETRWTVYLNKRELVSFMCTPNKLHYLAVGFLLAEGLISDLDDVLMIRVYEDVNRVYWYLPEFGVDEIRTMRVCEESVGAIDVRVKGLEGFPTKRTLTSGCGGGTTFSELSATSDPIESSITVTPGDIFRMMQELNQNATLYQDARGVHTSALGDGEELLIVAEDVGRHNTLDKIHGEALMRGVSTEDRVLLSTGRISSEMLMKTARMRVPIVVSRTSPTELALRLAEEWGITLIGYARSSSMNVYTGDERIILPQSEETEAVRTAERIPTLVNRNLGS